MAIDIWFKINIWMILSNLDRVYILSNCYFCEKIFRPPQEKLGRNNFSLKIKNFEIKMFFKEILSNFD